MDLRRKVGRATISLKKETSTYLKLFKANSSAGYLRYSNNAWRLSAKYDGYHVTGSFGNKEEAFDLYCDVARAVQARVDLNMRIETLSADTQKSDNMLSFLGDIPSGGGPNRGLTRNQVNKRERDQLPNRIDEFNRQSMCLDQFVQPPIRIGD
jgi:hypothetical protein